MKLLNQFTTVSQPTAWEETPDGFLRTKARVLAQRIMPYAREELQSIPDACEADPVMMLVTVDEMASPEALRSLEGAAVVTGEHNWVTPETHATFSRGNVAGAPQVADEYTYCDLLLTDPQAIEDIKAKRFPEISSAYLADTVFEPGTFNGTHYDAVQTNLRYNHIACIPQGMGRAGEDVRILNKQKKENEKMATVKVKLVNTGRFVNVEEDAAEALGAEQTAQETKDAASGKKLEDLMAQVADLNSQISALQAESDEAKGELSVYKEKLDELLSEEAVEQAALAITEDQAEATEILENAMCEESDEEKKKKEEVKNSIKKLFGDKLYRGTLEAVGVKCENMSPEAVRGAFKAQHQVMNSLKSSGRIVAGARLANKGVAAAAAASASGTQRTALERLGFKK